MNSMMIQEIASRYHFAKQVAQAAAELAFGFYQQRQQLEVEHKGYDLQDVASKTLYNFHTLSLFWITFGQLSAMLTFITVGIVTRRHAVKQVERFS